MILTLWRSASELVAGFSTLAASLLLTAIATAAEDICGSGDHPLVDDEYEAVEVPGAELLLRG